MNKVKKSALIIALMIFTNCFGFCGYAASNCVEIHMSVNGNDSNDGMSVETSVATLECAKKLAETHYKTYGSSLPIHILVHGGEYYFSKTVTLSSSVFGDKNKKGLKIMAYGDGDVIFTGAKELDKEALRPVDDLAVLSRLPQAGRGKVYCMSVKNYGLNPTDTSYPFLYVDDKEQIQSRWPNSGYATVNSLSSESVFGFSEENPVRWTQAKEAGINAFFQGDYFFGAGKIKSVNSEDKTITLDNSGNGKVFSSTDRVGAGWFARNLLEELDMPGEWFVDRNEGVLYFYPPYDLTDKKLQMVTFHNKAMIDIGSCKNIEISGITFEKSGGEAVKGNGAENISVTDCRFNYLQGRYAINLSDTNTNILIDSNECYGCHGGFVFCRSGAVNTLTSGNTRITNNHISSCGYEPVNTYAAICGSSGAGYERNGSVGTVVKNNLIQDGVTTYAILMQGCNNVISDNEIVNQSKHLKDAGAIYFGRSHTLRGTEVKHNYLHDFNRDNYIAGLYNDDSYSGVSWHHNICANMQTPSIHGMGMDENYSYNLAINCVNPNFVGSRTGWGDGLYDVGGALYNEMKTVMDNYSDTYLKEFPELKGALERTPYYAPYNSVFFGNVGINTNGRTIEVQGNSLSEVTPREEIDMYGAKTITRNGVSESIEGKNATEAGNPHFAFSDGYFVDAENQNYSIKEESDIAKAVPELLEINMESIGLSDLPTFEAPAFKIKEISKTESSAEIYWDNAENATKYKITVSENESMENPVFEKTVLENGTNNSICVEGLNGASTYYVTVDAIGLARQNQFNVSENASFTTASENDLKKDSLLTAINAMEKYRNKISDKNDYIVDEKYMSEIDGVIEEAKAVYNNSLLQEEIDLAENSIYSVAEQSDLYVEAKLKREISSCEPENATTIVHVTGENFEPGGNVSVLVTIPGNTLGEFAENKNIKNIVFMDTCIADIEGKVNFDFDTSIKGIDMPGEYTVYMNSEDGSVLEGKYTYGTIEIGEVSLFDESGNAIPEIYSGLNGKNITFKIPVISRISKDTQCKVLVCFYSDNVLVGTALEDADLTANSEKNIDVTAVVPETEDDITKVKIIMVNDFTFMNPMTTSRIIFETNK